MISVPRIGWKTAGREAALRLSESYLVHAFGTGIYGMMLVARITLLVVL